MHSTREFPARLLPVLRLLLPVLLLSLLAACAGTGRYSSLPVSQEAAQYRAHARSYYRAPGPASDPWGPYIREASARFDVPQRWIRSVMHQESGGHEFAMSQPGAMGLMQLMPPTYDDMRIQYGLGTDPYEPHDNILAGAAYIRQMYEIYGSPGFLAAYNTGPGRLDDFLTRNRPLPNETRQYVAIIGPQIAGIYPANRSQADLLVANHSTGVMLADAGQPPLSRSETRRVQTAWARKRGFGSDDDQPVQVAEALPPRTASVAAYYQPAAYHPAWRPLPRPLPRQQEPVPGPVPVPASVPASRGVQLAEGGGTRSVWASRLSVGAPPAGQGRPASEPVPPRFAAPRFAASGFSSRPGRRLRFIGAAMAEPVPLARLPGAAHDWAIQVGAFGSRGQASHAIGSARSRVAALAPAARGDIEGVHGNAGSLYRARLVGLTRYDAVQACQKLVRGRSECMVISPDSRS